MNDWFWYLNRIGFEESRYFLSIIADFHFSFLPLCTVNYQNTERGDISPLFSFIEMKEEQIIRELAEEAISENNSLFLVDVKVKGNTGNQKVLVFVDGDDGISIDECSRISRKIGSELEEADFMSGKYTLEVSSPGLDFPITLHRQYVKNVGRILDVEMTTGTKEGGELLEVSNDAIVLKGKEENRSLKFEEIKQSKVKVSFK